MSIERAQRADACYTLGETLDAVDILRDGTREWAPVGPARIPPNIVAMLLRDDDEGERE
jgi:hypothetical protein